MGYSVPEQSCSRPRCTLPGNFQAMNYDELKNIYYNGSLNGFWAKHNVIRLGPMALAGLELSFGQKGWAHGLYCKVGVQGPRPKAQMGLGVLCRTNNITKWTLNVLFSLLMTFSDETGFVMYTASPKVLANKKFRRQKVQLF